METEMQRLDELVEWETKVKNARLREKETKVTLTQCVDDTKAARKMWEEAVENTGRAIDAADEEFPLLDGIKAADKPGANRWRGIPVSEVEGFSKTIVKHLQAAGLTTLGKLADHCEKYALTDIKGIGDGMAETIDSALTDHWAAHP